MLDAQDGDVIGISGTITINGNQAVGYADKHVTFKRMTDSSYFYIQSESTFQNVTFDGGGINGVVAYVLSSAKVTYQGVTFKDCINNNANGGAAYIISNTVNFNNCTFENNTAVQGGHIYTANSSTALIQDSTLTNGHAFIDGGAIKNAESTATTNITSSIIKNNSANEYGGGLSNKGNMLITGTKIFDNTAPNGADIANAAYGNLNLADSIETLVELFQDEGKIPTAWVDDYDGSTSFSDTDIIPTNPHSLLKLNYRIPPIVVTLAPSSLGSAGDEKITGLESGKYYKVTADDVIYYAKGDGSLTTTESEASPLVETEIIGLTNGETYLVEEFTPAPTSVVLDAASLGTADNGKITGLSAGKMYKISVEGTVSYSKADGTLTAIEAEATALTGTEILGLTNGLTYLVEEYTAPVVDPEPSEPTDPTTPTEPENPDTPVVEPENPTDETPSDQTPDEEQPTDETPGQNTDEPTTTPDPTPTPDPKPVTPPSSNNNSGSSGHSSHSSSTVVTVTQPEPKKPALTYGKASLDTTKTEYLQGFADGLIGNKNTITRAEFAQMLYRLLTSESKTAVSSKVSSFTDVASNAWYSEAVNSMVNAGLISIGKDKKFNPDKNITWGEMLTIMAKFAAPNNDWKIITKHWAKDSINTAISYRWFSYTDEFNPDGEVTRAEMLDLVNTMFNWSKTVKN